MSEIRRVQNNLYPGARYVVRVRAINPFNVASDWSESFVFTTLTDTTTPMPPSNITGHFTPSELTISWDPPTTNTDGSLLLDLKGYEITLSAGATSVTYTTSGVNTYIYLTDQNIADFGGLQAAINIEMRSEDYSGNLSTAATGTSLDPIPPDPTVAPILVPAYNGIMVTLVPPPNFPDPKSFMLEHATSESGPFLPLSEVTETDTYFHQVDAGEENFYRFKVKDFFDQSSAGDSPISSSTVVASSGGGVSNDSIFFHMPGLVGLSPNSVAKKVFRNACSTIDVIGTFALAGSTETIVAIYKNEIFMQNFTIPPGEGRLTAYQETMDIEFDGTTDMISARVTSPGIGAEELGIEVVAVIDEEEGP